MHKRQHTLTTTGSGTAVSKGRFAHIWLAVLALGALVLLAPAYASAATLRAFVTTGSINANSNLLAVADASGFGVGDWVIVEIGKEPGQGQRGTRGVGGTWPARSYATEAHVYADNSLPDRTYVWAEDTGYVFWWLDGQWFNVAPNRANTFYTGSYYMGRAIPRSLQARINAINGNTLTLDKNAAVSVAGANVYLDTAPIISQMIAESSSLVLPAGNFPVGGVIWIPNRQGFVLAGQGKDQTRIYAPKGVSGASIEAMESPNTTIRDLTLHSNFRDQGFGLNWPSSTLAGSYRGVTETDVPRGSGWPRGIVFNIHSHNSVVQDVRVIDVSQMAVGALYSNNVWARRVESIQNDLMRQYLQWQFQWGQTDGGGCEDCEVRSTYLIPGFAAYQSMNPQFIRPKGTNAIFDMNSTGGFLIQDAYLRFTPNSLHPESDRIAASEWQPIININANSGVGAQVESGGTIRNAVMIQEGYINLENDSLRGIVVNEYNPDIRIEGAAYYAPDYKAPAVTFGAAGLDSTGLRTVVNGMVVIGKSAPGRTNIFIQRGSGQNCSGEVVEGCARGTFTSPALTEFLAGGSAGGSSTSTVSSTSTSTVSSTSTSMVTSSSTSTVSSTSTSTDTSGSTSTLSAISVPGASPNGTTGLRIVDTQGVVWSIDASNSVLRDGVPFQGGWGSILLWQNNVVYHKGVGTGEWYAWNAATAYWDSYGKSMSVAFDFAGTGTSGIMWRNYATGENAIWNLSGGAVTKASLIGGVHTSWRVMGFGDFNGDTKADILWRHDGGDVSMWLMDGSTITNNKVIATVPKSWTIVATGDFDGDGKADILWRESTGNLAIWLMDGTNIKKNVVLDQNNLPISWTVAGTGDFNGDGKIDILWRHEDGAVTVWLMDGTTIANHKSIAWVPMSWRIAGIGDFDGDRKADILWREDSGNVALWHMNGLELLTNKVINGVDASWTIVGAGDYDGDGKSDILWRNKSTGQNAVWLMNGFSMKGAPLIPSMPDANWSVVR